MPSGYCGDYAHFADEESEAEILWVTCPKALRKQADN